MKTISLTEFMTLLPRVVNCFFKVFGEAVAKETLRRSSLAVPVLTGALKGSGQAWYNGKLVISLGPGPNLRHFEIPSKDVVVLYSQSKRVGRRGKVFFYHGGQKWFDYSHFQEDVKGRAWMTMAVMSMGSILRMAKVRAMRACG